MMPNGEGSHCLVVKQFALLKKITSTNNDDFYCLNCLHSFRTKKKIGQPKKNNILKFDQYVKSEKALCLIYADLES